jgi:hypothetical protein
MAVEGIRTMAAGEFVPSRPEKLHRRRPNEPPVRSLPSDLAAAAVNETQGSRRESFSSPGIEE